MSTTQDARPSLLVATDIAVYYGAVRANDGIDVRVHEEEILGIIGPNGSGKSTLLRALSGARRPDRGSVSLDGVDITGWSVDRVARQGLIRVSQQHMVFPGVTVRESLRIAADCASGSEGSRRALPASTLIERLGLSSEVDRTVSDLPTGTLRRVGVACALAAGPRLLLLDEPAAGLNTQESADLGRALRSVHDAGTTVVVVDHDMSFVLPLCDRVQVLHLGKPFREGHPDEIAHDPGVIDVYLGGQFAETA